MSTFKDSFAARSDERWGMDEGYGNRFAAFLRKIWWSMIVMKKNFEHAGDGLRSRERSAERLRDEEAWSRMDGEGCPNLQPPYPDRDPIHQPDEVAPVAR